MAYLLGIDVGTSSTKSVKKLFIHIWSCIREINPFFCKRVVNAIEISAAIIPLIFCVRLQFRKDSVYF